MKPGRPFMSLNVLMTAGSRRVPLLEAFRRALAARANAERFRQIQARGMGRDDSWDGPAREYVKLYEDLLAKPSGTYRVSA